MEDAMEMDMEKEVPRLIADKAACTVATNTGADSIAAAANDESTAKTAWEEAVKARDALQAPEGAWGLADAARKAAVEAAVAQEVSEGIAALIDTMDEKAGDERAKAKLWLAAEAAHRAGVALKEKEAQALIDATELKGELEDAKNKAEAAVQAVTDQIASEKLSREYLYCELGAGKDAGDSSWWTNLTLDANKGTVG